MTDKERIKALEDRVLFIEQTMMRLMDQCNDFVEIVTKKFMEMERNEQ